MSLLGLRTLGLRPVDHAQLAAPARAPQGRRVVVDPRTRDRLVELHVLAEHGDAAAAEAGGWLSSDPDARRTWHQVDAQCRELRADAGDHVRSRPAGDGPPVDDAQRDVAPPEG
jgi:hypothetical protein